MRAELAVLTGDGSGQRYVIRVSQRFVIGRGRAAAIRFSDSAISRKHAEVHLDEMGRMFVTDLGSSNGTFLEGKRLKPLTPTRVSNGEAITVGANVIVAKITSEKITKKVLARIKETEAEQRELLEGRFEIVGPLGQGAYASVYVARFEDREEPVAVKVMKLDKDVDGEHLARFLREGRTTQRLRHPRIVKTYETLVKEDQIVLVMELINGPSLLDRLRGGPPMQIPEALRLARGVAEGLAAAHEAGIVHRDVKPSNILLGPDGPKLGDFGIAKDSAAREDLTESNLGLGSLPYVPPEQAVNAKDADARSDIYALGATLYHMLAGHPPFRTKGAGIFRQILHEMPTPLVDVRAGCPSAVSDYVSRMMDKKPDARPQTAGEVVAALQLLYDELIPQRKLTRILKDDPETAQLPRGFYKQAEQMEADDDPLAETSDGGPPTD